MWVQFLDEPWVRVASSTWPTVLSLKRPADWTVAQRLEVLERWSPRLTEPGVQAELARACHDQALAEGAALQRELNRARSSRLGSWGREHLPPAAYRQLRRPVRWVRRLRPR
jgi:hypothetical protein